MNRERTQLQILFRLLSSFSVFSYFTAPFTLRGFLAKSVKIHTVHGLLPNRFLVSA